MYGIISKIFENLKSGKIWNGGRPATLCAPFPSGVEATKTVATIGEVSIARSRDRRQVFSLSLALIDVCVARFFHGRFLIRLSSRLRQRAGHRNKQIVAFPIITSATRPQRVTLSRFEISNSRIIATTGGELERDRDFYQRNLQGGTFNARRWRVTLTYYRKRHG